MSVTVTTDIFCACGMWIHGYLGARVSVRAARVVAKEKGWERKKVDGKLQDVCPLCTGKYEVWETEIDGAGLYINVERR